MREIGNGMNNYPNSEVPLSDADRSEIEALFIALMRARDQEADPVAPHADNASLANEKQGGESLDLPFFDPPGNMNDLRSQWGL
jgi:hypothetical protein